MIAYIRLAILALACAGAFFTGSHLKQGQWDAARAAQAEVDREAQRSRDHETIRQLDTFAQKLKAEQGATVAAARDAERVRSETDRIASRARANAAEPGSATVASLAELLGEGAGLLEEGRRYLGDCRAAQDALTLAPAGEQSKGDR